MVVMTSTFHLRGLGLILRRRRTNSLLLSQKWCVETMSVEGLKVMCGEGQLSLAESGKSRVWEWGSCSIVEDC